MSWRSDFIATMTACEAETVLALVAGGCPEVFDWAFGAVGGSLRERFEQARQEVPEEVRECRHCGGSVRRCTSTCASSPDYPLCKGWRHVGYDDQPVIGHCCGGRSVNPAAEPREGGRDA